MSAIAAIADSVATSGVGASAGGSVLHGGSSASITATATGASAATATGARYAASSAVWRSKRGPQTLGEVEIVLVVARVEGQRLVVGGLGTDVAVLRHAGPRGDQLPDDDVLLEALEAVVLALDRGLGEHPRRLLEGGGGQPRLGRERRLRDPHELGTTLGRALALGHEPLVHVGELPGVSLLTRQERRVTRLRHGDPAEHLADDDLDVLVVDRHALLPVHLLHLVAEVLLGGPDAVDVQDLLRVPGRLGVTGQLLRRR